MENNIAFNPFKIVNQLFLYSAIVLLFFIPGCSKNTPEVTQASPGLTKTKNFTSADATKAYTDFNTVFYSPNDKLYYSTTEKKDNRSCLDTSYLLGYGHECLRKD